MSVSETLSAILTGAAREAARSAGPVKWCRRCSRKHATHAGCQLIPISTPAKSERMVKAWTAPPR